jgi:hypothetical protein
MLGSTRYRFIFFKSRFQISVSSWVSHLSVFLGFPTPSSNCSINVILDLRTRHPLLISMSFSVERLSITAHPTLNSLTHRQQVNSRKFGAIVLRRTVQTVTKNMSGELSTHSPQPTHCYCPVCSYITALCSNMFRPLLGLSSGIRLKAKMTQSE